MRKIKVEQIGRIDFLCEKIQEAVNYMTLEYPDLMYSDIIAALEIAKFDMLQENRGNDERGIED